MYPTFEVLYLSKLGKNERLVMIYVTIFTIVAFALFVGWAGNEVIKI